MQGDLTSLARAAPWLAPDQGVLVSQNDTLIARLISAVSVLALGCMGRDTLAKTERTEVYDGGRTGMLLLRHWPVIAPLGSLTIAPGAPLAASEFTLEAPRPAGGSQRIYLANGRTFVSPMAGVTVTYTTGFVTRERLTAPSGTAPKVTTSLFWLGDEGVTRVDGTPVVGYSVANGVYTLPDALASTDVYVSYSYCPADIEQAVIQEVAMLARSRQHIGESSKALPGGGGTMAYLPVDLAPITKLALQRYQRVVA